MAATEDETKSTVIRRTNDVISTSTTATTAEQKPHKLHKYVHAPFDKYGSYARWFRHKLLAAILVGEPVLLTIQRHRTPLRTKFMKFLSFLGTEDFFTVLLIFMFWIIDQRLARLFGALMAIGFLITGSMKTLLCLPRPPSPPIQPLEKAHDWALPSHHSLIGVLCPWYIWLYANLNYEMTTFQMGVLFCTIVFWSFGVMLSRLYLGVHSPADIVCGGIVGVFVLSVWMLVDDYVDFYISQRLYMQLEMFVLIFFLLLCHPSAERGNPSFPDTVCVTAVFFGSVLGRSLRNHSRTRGSSGQWMTLIEAYPQAGLFKFVLLTFARFFIGVLEMIVVKTLTKLIMKQIVLQVFSACGMTWYSSKEHLRKYPQNKHYDQQFRLPPVNQQEYEAVMENEQEEKNGDRKTDDNNKQQQQQIDTTNWYLWLLSKLGVATVSFKEDWDIDIPIDIVVYTILTYSAVDICPQLFNYFNV